MTLSLKKLKIYEIGCWLIRASLVMSPKLISFLIHFYDFIMRIMLNCLKKSG